MAFGWSLVTPMQTLAFYNAVANNGIKTTICVRNKRGTKPLLKWKEVINPQICSTETLLKLKAVLKMWLKRDRVKTLLKGSRWQVKQGQHKLIMAKMVGQANTMLRLCRVRQITLSFV
jgi:cell division protein FtsI/penicillin-binding protein 2